MSKENFEKQIRKRMEQLDEINKHGIFKELKGTVTDFNYDTKSLTMTFEATKFHENAFGTCLEVLWQGCLILHLEH